ncbi:ARM repeat-containing protein [Meredithblackwellia eburnea MCA 4105]
MTDDSAVQQVVQALQSLYHDPDPTAKEKANAWLSDFQKTNEAWATAQLLLFAPDAPLEAKLFGAQTFRSKVTYDLELLPPDHRLPLRDSLLNALKTFAPSGPKVVLTQVCLALADLALQLNPDEWKDPTSDLIDQLGKEPTMAGGLLEFLQVVTEEFSGNMRIKVNNDFGNQKAPGVRGTEMGEKVVALLAMYLQAPGITVSLQNQCYACLGSWLRTGQAVATSVNGTPILNSLFTALSNDELFDAAVDCLVDLIHETQELEDNMSIIQSLVPLLAALRPHLLDPDTREDEDRMRGYCRILVEAGEWYDLLIVPHIETFLPIVEAIATCAAYDNLAVAGITLNFWYRLSRAVAKARSSGAPAVNIQPLLDIFSSLVGTIIRHLHYPLDDATLTGQERDDFRNFRHTIGDTLKDCCTVLSANVCLKKALDIISENLAKAKTTNVVNWQEVEAPLFSMRSMGAEVDPNDNEVIPFIMELLPHLPPHPRIRYAAILVIGRYTPWIQLHPDLIAFHLPYVVAGFEDTDKEVWAASAQTLKYLCKDCSEQLVPYLPQLHSFLGTYSSRIGAEDLMDIYAGIGHVICVMNLDEAPQVLSTFCMPNIEIVHQVTVQPAAPMKAELLSACDALDRVDVLLSVVDRFPDGLPDSCKGTCVQVWSVLEQFLVKFARADSRVPEKVCVVVRRGLALFDDEAFEVAPRILDTLVNAFEVEPVSSYLWIVGKMVGIFARRAEPAYEASMSNAVQRATAKVVAMLQVTEPSRIADILDDYSHLILDLIEYHPDILLSSPSFGATFQILLSSTTLLSPVIVLSALDNIRAVIGHESLVSATAFPAAFGQAIRGVVDAAGGLLVQVLMQSLVDGVEDASTTVLTIFRMLAVQFPQVLVAHVGPTVEGLPEKLVGRQEKVEFMSKFTL